MASPFIETIIQQLIWVNIIASLVVVLMLHVRQGVIERITSKLTTNNRNAIGFFILWLTVLLLPILFVPIEFQIELIVEILKNFAVAVFPIGPTMYIIISWNQARLNNSKDHGLET